MNPLKEIIVGGLVLTGTAVSAQNNPDSGLNLSTEQQQKWDSIHEKYKAEYKTIMLDKTLTGAEKSKKLEELSKRELEAQESILTKEQAEKFRKMTEKKSSSK